MSDNLELSKIRQQFDLQCAEYEGELASLQAELEDIRSTIRGLEEQRQQVTEQIKGCQRALESLFESRNQAELEAILAALAESQSQIRPVGGYWSSLQDIERQRQSLFTTVPSLEQDWQDYQAFESEPGSILGSVPSYYHHSLQEAHQCLRQRLTQLFELEEKAKAVHCPENILIQVAIVADTVSNHIRWILPIPSRREEPLDTNGGVDEFAKIVLDALGRLNELPNWYLAEMSSETWGGYFVLSMLAEYTNGEKTLVELTREQLCTCLAENPLFQRIVPNVCVAEISLEVWKKGQQVLFTAPVPAGTGVPEEDITVLPDLGQCIFTKEDIVSWERPLKVSVESSWNVQARRLRTLFIRLIAKGKVGREGMAVEHLWQGLPELHQHSFQNALPNMLEKNLLTRAVPEGESGELVSVNPRMLTEVQSLINRDMTPFWTELVEIEKDYTDGKRSQHVG